MKKMIIKGDLLIGEKVIFRPINRKHIDIVHKNLYGKVVDVAWDPTHSGVLAIGDDIKIFIGNVELNAHVLNKIDEPEYFL